MEHVQQSAGMLASPEPAWSTVSSETGSVEESEVAAMRERIVRGELTMRRVLDWVEAGSYTREATKRGRDAYETGEAGAESGSAAGGPAQAMVGRRTLAKTGELSVGRHKPPIGARVEVEFTDFAYTGTVRAPPPLCRLAPANSLRPCLLRSVLTICARRFR